MTKQDNHTKSILAVFQMLMALLSILLLYIAFNLIFSKSIRPETGNTFPMDSTITASTTIEKDSAKKSTTKSDIKKEYKIKEDEAPIVKEYYDTALSYCILAAGVLILAFFLPRIQTLNFKDISVTVKEEVEAKVEEAKDSLSELVNSSIESTVGEGGKRAITKEEKIPEIAAVNSDSKKIMLTESRIPERPNIKTDIHIGLASTGEDDPQKGKWGGKSMANGRALIATIKKIKRFDLCSINLRVESIDPNKPLKGKVKFHLHNTFTNPNPVIAVVKGIASLDLDAWGAFTVGAEADDGITKLELDLSRDEVEAPKEWKEA